MDGADVFSALLRLSRPPASGSARRPALFRRFVKFVLSRADKKIMGMLDRYKKKGGFVQLLNLIETSGKQKQEQFLSLIGQESPVWEEAIRQKSLSLDKILSWDSSYLREIFSRLQPLTLATALHGMPKEKTDVVMSLMSVTDQRKIQQVLDESSPTPAEVGTCIMKIITETRGFIVGGIIKIEKIDPSLVIVENIEEQLANQSVTRSLGMMSSPATEEVSTVMELVPETKSECKAEHSKEEVEFLKKKVNQLVGENAALKQELAVLRGKLDQIKKIA